MIKFFCTHCGQSISTDDEDAGTQGNCPACSREVSVPGNPPVRIQAPPQPRPEKSFFSGCGLWLGVFVLVGIYKVVVNLPKNTPPPYSHPTNHQFSLPTPVVIKPLPRDPFIQPKAAAIPPSSPENIGPLDAPSELRASEIRAFNLGDKAAFDSSGHPKANGIRMKLFYPKTWKAMEGTRPHILQKIVSDNGTGMSMALVQVVPLPPEPSEVAQLTTREKNEMMVSEEIMKELFVPTGSTLHSYKLSKLDGEPCGIIETSTLGDRAGLKIASFNTTFAVPVKGALLVIQTSFGGNAADGT